MDAASIAVGVLGGAGAGGFWAFLATRTKAPADMTTAQAAFQTALSQQAEGFIKALQADRQALTSEVAELRHRVGELEHENSQCRGENAQMQQRIESLEQHLRRKGIDIPRGPRPRGLTVLENGKATVITLDTPQPKPARRRSRKAST